LAASDAEQLSATLKVIADPARLRLLSLIQAQPGHEACVCHLTEPLGLSQPTVSHHLKCYSRPAWSIGSSAGVGRTFASAKNRSPRFACCSPSAFREALCRSVVAHGDPL
jgi:ArsR family transcriptional regulator